MASWLNRLNQHQFQRRLDYPFEQRLRYELQTRHIAARSSGGGQQQHLLHCESPRLLTQRSHQKGVDRARPCSSRSTHFTLLANITAYRFCHGQIVCFCSLTPCFLATRATVTADGVTQNVDHLLVGMLFLFHQIPRG